MNYQKCVEWVHSLPRLAKKPGIENTRLLLKKLGNPEKNLRFVHIAGTNGKGSATIMLASILKHAGYKTGANISPYVLDFRERFLINGEMIAEEALAKILSQVKAAAEGEDIVEFDAVTAAAILWFSQQKCDIVCMETGLGGRLDSTNAVENTLAAVIMAIGKDHTELLGDTYQKIAAEKCGIIKHGCDVICCPKQPQEAMDEITIQASEKGSKLFVPDLQDLKFYKCPPFENRIDYGGYDLEIPFAGRHQAYNAITVLETALRLCEKGFDISDDAIIGGIKTAAFPARIEIISKEPLVILDGAHNPDGARALAETLKAAGKGKLSAVIGILDGKSPDEMLSALAPCFSHVYTVTPNSPRALTAQQLAALAKKHFADVTACDNISKAISLAKEDGDGVVVCGSLYLAAEARKILLG
ncbi:MAG: bifunctional folylpolyglutamate synthase/dihydrofolate synthase [Clostridia bacterium]|nr:bifunctional folylpolyglutamate synthase/dihydrofolate synthase [Clostridia bacterium]